MSDRPDSENLECMRVAIVYQVLHHFREPIFTSLVESRSGAPVYHFFGAAENTLDSNRTIDPARADLPRGEGGLPWTFVRNLPLGGPFFWQTGILRAAWDAETQVIIFLGNMYYLSTWVAATVARLRGKRVLFWGHGYTRRERGVQGWLRACFYRLGHGLLLYGTRARDLLRERGFSQDTLYVVYNSLDYESQRAVREATTLDELRALRQRLFADPELPILVYIGRVEARKKLEELVDTVQALELSGVGVNLLVIGDGNARAGLVARAAELGLENRVHFYGACYDEAEAGPLLMASTLCVCPAALGLTAIHAMAYGLPVLSHGDLDAQGPEVEAIEPGLTGDLFDREDPSDLARKVERWLRDHPEPQEVASRCIEAIESRYHAARQTQIIDQAVAGIPAGAIHAGGQGPERPLQRGRKAAES